MANVRATIIFCAVMLMVAALSSFTVVSAEESSKSSEEHSSEKDASVADDSSAQEDSKEKRSREEILFGNQQNKPNGLVDDLMSMTEEDAESTKDDDKRSKKSEEDQTDDTNSKEDKRMARPGGNDNDMMMGSGSDNWYNTEPASPSAALQYLASAPSLQSLPTADFSNSLYDQEDLYRRKRQLLGHPLPLRKRRSLRNSLGQMIQKRGIRMPRRSMRLKRQVDLLTLLGNDGFYDEPQQVPSSNFNGWEKRVEKKHVPGHFSAYPETPAPEFRYPFTFQHRDDGVLSLPNEFEDTKTDDEFDPDTMDELQSLMLLHPNARYIETPEGTYFPYRTRDEEAEAFQAWLARHTTPNIFTVSRRSSPTFYPLDYRYMPGYKKRSPVFRGNRMSSGFYGDSEDTDSDVGKWGHVVQMPDGYASAEDVARLYGLASLMADGDDDEKVRKSV